MLFNAKWRVWPSLFAQELSESQTLGTATDKAGVKVALTKKETEKFSDAFRTPRSGLNPAMEVATRKAGDLAAEQDTVRKAMEKAEKEAKALADAAKALTKEQDRLKDAFADTINPSKELSEKLNVLLGEFDREDVVKAHWQEIVTAAEKSAEYDTALDPLIASLLDEAEAIEGLTVKME